MDSDDETQEISSSNYLCEDHLEQDVKSPLSNEAYLILQEHSSATISAKQPISMSHYTIGSQKSANSQLELQRPSYVSSSQEKYKKNNTKVVVGYDNDCSFPNNTNTNSHYSNLNRVHFKSKNRERPEEEYIIEDGFSSRASTSLWQGNIADEKSYIQLSHSKNDNVLNCPEDMLVASSSNRKLITTMSVSDSLVDARSPMLSDYATQHSSLLLENCLVSSSTGHIDTISIPTIASISGESDNFLYNSNLLDSTVHSTSEEISKSCSSNNSKDQFDSACSNISAAKFSTDGHNFQNERYFIFDHILNDAPRITQGGETSNSEKNDFLGIPGPSGITRFNKNNSKFIKLNEKSPQEKNVLYCIQNFPFEVENSNTTPVDILSLKDSISSTEFHSETSVCEQQCSALNLNKLSSEFYLDKKFSPDQEANIFAEETFSSVEYTDGRINVVKTSREPLNSSQQFTRDDFITRAAKSPILQHSHLRINQHEQLFIGHSECFDIEMNSAQDMTTCKRIIPQELQATSNIYELTPPEEEKNRSHSNFIPEDLSSPFKHKNKDYGKPIDDLIDNTRLSNEFICRKKSSENLKKEHPFGSSYSQFGLPMSEIKLDNNVNIENVGIWCDECDKCLPTKCNVHTIRTIIDKPVCSRPLASIPTPYLCIKVINNETNTSGIFTRKTIARRVKFGPVEGPFLEGEPLSPKGFFVTRNAVRGYLDTSDDNTSNWMKFVRWAESFTEMNCVAVEEENSIYFITTVDIQPKKELRIGYSKQYSMKYGLQYLKPSEEELAALEPKIKWWSCSVCSEKFKLPVLLEDHLAVHDTDEPKKKRRRKVKYKKKTPKAIDPECNENNSRQASLHECEVCLLRFPISDLLVLHKELHAPTDKWNRMDYKEKKENNSCPTCYQMFESRNDLSHHVNNHSVNKNDSPVGPHKCNLCYKYFETEDKLLSHGIIHLRKGDTDFPCQLCHRRFVCAQTLTSHQKFHKDNPCEYICPMCNKKFESLGLMKLHIPEHCINGAFTCPYCQKTFPIYHKIRRHIRTYHPETVHPCPQCGKTLSSMDKLKLHMLSHSDRRDFICDVCNRGFKRKDKLKEHQKRGHANIHGKVGTKIINIKATNKHIENFKYKCDQCIRGFKRRGMLVNHLSKQHPNIALDTVPELVQPILKECRIFFCHYCNKSYETSSKRKVHILKHHPGAALIPADAQGGAGKVSKVCNTVVLSPKKAFAVACPHCPRQYATNAKLLQHQRKHHNKQEKSLREVTVPPSMDTLVMPETSLVDASQLIRLTPLTPVAAAVGEPQLKLDDAGYVCNVPTAAQPPVMLEGDFSDEQTLTVLASNSDESFCVALRPGQLLSNIGVLCPSELPYVLQERPQASAAKGAGAATFANPDDTFEEEHINFAADPTKGECIFTQVDSNSPVILWQPGIFSNVN